MNQDIIIQFGNRVRSLRTLNGWSQERLAELTGFHRTYIGMVERGERNISLKNIAILAKSFELSPSQLLDFTD
jgi:transcriptional regulator with XRE-family HTH domain